MDNEELRHRFGALTTAHLADACLRVGLSVRCAPANLQTMVSGDKVAGRVAPVRHVGSVDVFLEALETAGPGDVLVVDNGGRLDESCVGDLVTLEMYSAGLAGIVIWGLHRDTGDIAAIGLPLFSLGSIPTGPLSLSARPADVLQRATVGEWAVNRDDVVLGDDDGVLFVPAARAAELFVTAEGIRDTERRQADRIRSGNSLRDQVRFTEYLTARERNPELGFREHLRGVGGEIEV
jgi:regulator of RNase E activity RraA